MNYALIVAVALAGFVAIIVVFALVATAVVGVIEDDEGRGDGRDVSGRD